MEAVIGQREARTGGGPGLRSARCRASLETTRRHVARLEEKKAQAALLEVRLRERCRAHEAERAAGTFAADRCGGRCGAVRPARGVAGRPIVPVLAGPAGLRRNGWRSGRARRPEPSRPGWMRRGPARTAPRRPCARGVAPRPRSSRNTTSWRPDGGAAGRSGPARRIAGRFSSGELAELRRRHLAPRDAHARGRGGGDARVSGAGRGAGGAAPRAHRPGEPAGRAGMRRDGGAGTVPDRAAPGPGSVAGPVAGGHRRLGRAYRHVFRRDLRGHQGQLRGRHRHGVPRGQGHPQADRGKSRGGARSGGPKAMARAATRAARRRSSRASLWRSSSPTRPRAA